MRARTRACARTLRVCLCVVFKSRPDFRSGLSTALSFEVMSRNVSGERAIDRLYLAIDRHRYIIYMRSPGSREGGGGVGGGRGRLRPNLLTGGGARGERRRVSGAEASLQVSEGRGRVRGWSRFCRRRGGAEGAGGARGARGSVGAPLSLGSARHHYALRFCCCQLLPPTQTRRLTDRRRPIAPAPPLVLPHAHDHAPAHARPLVHSHAHLRIYFYFILFKRAHFANSVHRAVRPLFYLRRDSGNFTSLKLPNALRFRLLNISAKLEKDISNYSV